MSLTDSRTHADWHRSLWRDCRRFCWRGCTRSSPRILIAARDKPSSGSSGPVIVAPRGSCSCPRVVCPDWEWNLSDNAPGSRGCTCNRYSRTLAPHSLSAIGPAIAHNWDTPDPRIRRDAWLEYLEWEEWFEWDMHGFSSSDWQLQSAYAEFVADYDWSSAACRHWERSGGWSRTQDDNTGSVCSRPWPGDACDSIDGTKRYWMPRKRRVWERIYWLNSQRVGVWVALIQDELIMRRSSTWEKGKVSNWMLI